MFQIFQPACRVQRLQINLKPLSFRQSHRQLLFDPLGTLLSLYDLNRLFLSSDLRMADLHFFLGFDNLLLTLLNLLCLNPFVKVYLKLYRLNLSLFLLFPNSSFLAKPFKSFSTLNP